MPLARRQWTKSTRRLRSLQLATDAVYNVRSFINWLYWTNILIPGIECLLAQLIAIEFIGAVDVRGPVPPA